MQTRFYLIQLWSWIVHVGLPVSALLIIAILIPRLGRLTVRMFTRRLDESEEATKSKLALIGALVYVFEAVLFFIITIRALTLFGVPATSAAIPATVVSAAIGFGAQKVIGDFLAGFFIISERQFGVGDFVSFDGTTNTVAGTVVKLTLRATQVRTPAGEVVTVPNGSAGVITNYSQEWARALVDISIPLRAHESVADLTKAVEGAAKNAISESDDPAISKDVTGSLDVLPAMDVVQPTAAGNPWAVTFRVIVEVSPARQWAVERAIRAAIINEFWDRWHENPDTLGAILDSATEPTSDRNQNIGQSAPGSAGARAVAADGDRAGDQPTEVFDSHGHNALSPRNTSTAHDGDNADDGDTEDTVELASANSGHKDDGPGHPSTSTADKVETKDILDEALEKPELNYEQRVLQWLSFGGRVRVSTTLLFLALLIIGSLALMSSNPDQAEAGWLAPDRLKAKVSSSAPEPSSSPSTTEKSETPTSTEPTTSEDADNSGSTNVSSTAPRGGNSSTSGSGGQRNGSTAEPNSNSGGSQTDTTAGNDSQSNDNGAASTSSPSTQPNAGGTTSTATP